MSSYPRKPASALARIAVVVSAAVICSSHAVAADYSIDISQSSPESAANDLKRALEIASIHRKSVPDDKILIELPRLIRLAGPIRLGAEIAGKPEAPLVLRGSANKPARIEGGVDLELAALAAEQRDLLTRALSVDDVKRIRVLSLALVSKAVAPKITPRDTFSVASARLSVFEGSRRLSLSQWPLRTFERSARAKLDAASGLVDVELPRSFPNLDTEPFLWVAGYWKRNWWYEISKIVAHSDASIQLALPKSGIGASPRFVLLNTLEGLQREGAYVVDPRNDLVYVRPFRSDPTSVSVPVAESALLIEKTSSVAIQNVAIEHTIGPAVLIKDSNNIELDKVFVGHVGSGHGIEIIGGTDNVVSDSVVTDVGEVGVILDGGNRASLAPGNNQIRTSLITAFGRAFATYRPGVRLSGVQNSVVNCEIADGEHAGIIFSGNEHSIEGNNIHDVVLDTSDAGALYAGRDWTSRGNRIISNWIHNVRNNVDQASVAGVYLDDGFSGALVKDNLFQNVQTPILVGGGRDNRFESNIFVGFEKASVAFDARGLNWLKDMVTDGPLRQGLDRVPYQSGEYLRRYPELAAILQNNPGAPLNNTFMDNKVIGGKLLDFATPDSGHYPILRNNIEFNSSERPITLSELETVTKDSALLKELWKLRERTDQQQRALNALREFFVPVVGGF